MTVHFEWNREKLQTNFKKHHVSFEEAVTVFANPLFINIASKSVKRKALA